MTTLHSAEPVPAPLPVQGRATRKEEALWLLEQMVPGTAVNNLAFAFSAAWRMDVPMLGRALDFVLDRYEILRTVFHARDGGLDKRVMPAGVVHVDLDEADVDQDAVAATLTRFIGATFAMDGRPMLRARLLHTVDGDVFCLAVHHLVFDSLSTSVLLDDFSAVYLALRRGEEIPATLLDTVAASVDVEPTPASREYWREQLTDFDNTELGLWVGSEVDDDPTLTGATLTRPLPPAALDVVRRLQKELRAPEAVILLAAYYLLLAQHGAGPDLVVGSPVNSRRPADMRAIGYHVNVVPLRLKLDVAESFAALVRRTRGTFLNGISRADVPVDELLLEVPRDGASWRNTLFRHVFNYARGTDPSRFERAGIKNLSVENGFSKFDLEFFILPNDQAITIRVVYHTGAFTAADADLLLRRYMELFTEVAEDVNRPVGELTGWSAVDHEVIDAANRTGAAAPPVDVLTAVARQCRATPDAVAVEDGDRVVSYRQLWQAAARTRAVLAQAGVGPGEVVGVAAARSPELAAAVLGVWLASACYLPIDPGHPAARIGYQLENAAARVVLVGPDVLLPAGASATAIPVPPVTAVDEPDELAEPAAPAPDSCAYLIYTSGSTGKPKGTLLSHANLANLVSHFQQELAVAAGAGVLWSTTFTFDISALELFLPLVCGGRLVVAGDPARTDGKVLAQLLVRHDVRVVQATPTSWRLLVEDAADALAGRTVLCGGEALPLPLARRLAHTGADVRNVYGPTETCIWSTSGTVRADQSDVVTVGRPIRETQVFVTDPVGRELPIGVRGELCIAGVGVALGYHERPELTAERFGEHPRYGRFYRTGDAARWLPDGTIEVLGRGDRQIKLRGNRIELGEVEVVLGSHPAVRAAAVVLVGDPSADAVLVAWIETGPVADEVSAQVVDSLWQHAREQLPAASVPQEFLFLPALPTNVNLKVDYPTLTRMAVEQRAQAPAAGVTGEHEDELVRLLIAHWCELLGRSDVVAETNFFAHGGHSLLGAKLVQLVERAVDVQLRLADLFARPTPLALAALVRQRRAELAPGVAPVPAAPAPVVSGVASASGSLVAASGDARRLSDPSGEG